MKLGFSKPMIGLLQLVNNRFLIWRHWAVDENKPECELLRCVMFLSVHYDAAQQVNKLKQCHNTLFLEETRLQNLLLKVNKW